MASSKRRSKKKATNNVGSKRKRLFNRKKDGRRVIRTKYGIKYVDENGRRIKSFRRPALTPKQRAALRKAQQASALKRKRKKKNRGKS